MRKGFTLLELLVVVLIIGILAAVALPQYKKAAERSKATQAITLLKSVYQAAKAYELANGSWPKDFDSLAVNIPFTGHTSAARTGGHFQRGLSNGEWSIQLQAPMAATGATNGSGVFITRISGPYTGGAFAIYSRWPSVILNLPTDQIVCRESVHTNNYYTSMLFTKNQGEYCEKIIKAKFTPTSYIDRFFVFP